MRKKEMKEMQKDNATLVKIIKMIKMIPGNHKGKEDASKNQVSVEHVQSLLRTFHNLDNLILNLQNLLNRCGGQSFYIQQQLKFKCSSAAYIMDLTYHFPFISI